MIIGATSDCVDLCESAEKITEKEHCMIMIGQMKRYRESLKKTPDPILLSQIQKKMDLRGLMTYAQERGMKVAELSEQERMSFVKK